jgi:hypothetical protein
LTTHSDTWLKTIAELYGDDYLNDLLYDPSEGQSDNMAEAPKYASRQIGGSIYTEFGKIAGVEHDERYLTLINEHSTLGGLGFTNKRFTVKRTVVQLSMKLVHLH